MRIELPLPSWAEAQRAQDDAHTLTLPAQHPHTLPGSFLAGLPAPEGIASRVEVLAGRPLALTLTL